MEMLSIGNFMNFFVIYHTEIDNSLNIDVPDNMLARFLRFIIDPGESAFAYWTQRCMHHEQTGCSLDTIELLWDFLLQ